MSGAGAGSVPTRFARYLGSFPRLRTNVWVMIGQDGGQSIDLGERTLFVFSDTLLAPRNPEFGQEAARLPFQLNTEEPCIFLANCGALSAGGDLRECLGAMRYFCDQEGFPVELLAATAGERAANLRFWPAHGVCVEGKVYLYYLGVETVDPTTIWGFRNIGVGLAVLDPESGECRRIYRNADWRLWRVQADDFHFGVQTIPEGDYVYVFGSVRQGYEVRGLVGRVPVERLDDPSAYTYLNATTEAWTADVAQAGSLGACASDYSVSYNPYLGGYLMVYVDGHTKHLALRLAERVTGPYSPPQIVGRVPHGSRSELVYLGFEHPKFAGEGGRRIYVSYCQPYFTPTALMELRFR